MSKPPDLTAQEPHCAAPETLLVSRTRISSHTRAHTRYMIFDFDPKLGTKGVFFGSFYFWLDIIATASLILEIPWFIPVSYFGGAVVLLDLGTMTGSFSSGRQELAGSVGAARAGRASRAGARAGRVIRLVRIVRLYNIYASNKKKKMDKVKGLLNGRMDGVAIEQRISPEEDTDTFADAEEEEPPAESHVGKTMGDITTQKVIVGVLLMLIMLPLMTFNSDDDVELFSCRLAHTYFTQYSINNVSTPNQLMNKHDFYSGLTAQVKEFVDSSKAPERIEDVRRVSGRVLDLYFINETQGKSLKLDFQDLYYKLPGISDYRDSEILAIHVKSAGEQPPEILEYLGVEKGTITKFDTYAFVDAKFFAQESGQNGFILTIFVIALLVCGTMVFAADTNRLVILPIENMIARVNAIIEHPMEQSKHNDNIELKEGMETTFLLQTIDKIGNLMRIGFGEAGAEIIGRNLRNTKPGEELNLLGGAREIWSIFGFCDIRNFTDTTECLQTEVMVFVNKVAHVLHGIIKDCDGAANKNIGDAFLLTWKLPATSVKVRAHE